MLALWVICMCAPARAADYGTPGASDLQVRRVAPRHGTVVLQHLQIPVNKSQTIRTKGPFNDVLVGSSQIVDAIPLNDRTIYVLGKRLGTTNLTIRDSDSKLLEVVNVEVTLDVGSIASKVYAGVGSRSIKVRTQGDKVILSGVAADTPSVDRAVMIAGGLAPGGVINTTRIASPQQVMLKVRFVEVNRTAEREFVFRFEPGGSDAAFRFGRVGPAAPLTTTPATGIGLLSDVVPAVAAATFSGTPFGHGLARFGGGSSQLDMIISALEQRGLARRLAEPNLVALSGETAEFLAGGEYPIPVAGSTQQGVPTVTIAFKEFGVRLRFTPTVLANGLINLQLVPEVSEIDPSVSVNTGIITVPGLSKRQARTTVELRDGQSFAIAGLLQATTQRDIDQMPWLGSVPVIGALLRSTAFQQRETELVVIVTPHLVRPAKPGTVMATPLDTTIPANDPDLFVGGKLEVEKDPRAALPAFINTDSIGPHGHILTAAPIAGGNGDKVLRAKN